MVNCNNELKNCFKISYLKECEVNINNHKLSYSTSRHNDYNAINKCLVEEKRHITNTKREILNYDIGFLMTEETCKALLSEISDINEVRYIVLTNKTCLPLNNKENFNYYSYTDIEYVKLKLLGFTSMLVIPRFNVELINLSKLVLKKLIFDPPDSLHGTSIVADAPEYNIAMLNVQRPGVLRQYYGMDIDNINDQLVTRVAYRSNTSFTSEGSNPLKLIIKPFTTELMLMSNHFYNFLNNNKKI